MKSEGAARNETDATKVGMKPVESACEQARTSWLGFCEANYFRDLLVPLFALVKKDCTLP